ncbi:MAG: type IV pilus biogenesis/stability protein PilW [Gammaproteobacteria bacterium]|nr:type IV pilus biogenesis/stability protein PilW [Gammaproteobacteria bacterium]
MIRTGFLLTILVLLTGLSACTTQTTPLFKEVNKKKSAEANASLGLQYMLNGNYARAMEKLNRALEYDSNSGSAHHYIAELYRRLDEVNDADKHYRRASKLSPDNVDLANNYGVFLCGEKRYRKAEKQFRKVLKDPVYSHRAKTFENMALCQGENKRKVSATAEKYFREALRLDPTLPKSLMGMAEISLYHGRALKGREFLQRYLNVATQTPQSLWIGIRIERILNDKNAVSSYGMLLKGTFPESNEAKLYLDSEK